jgi:hypothetical protein
MIAGRSTQGVLPPCASGLCSVTRFTPGGIPAGRAVRAPGEGPAGRIFWRGPGGPRGPPQ